MQTFIHNSTLTTTKAAGTGDPPAPGWLQPRFDCRELADRLTITLYVPGVDSRDIAVDVAGADLTVTARKPRPVRANWHALQLENAQRDYRLRLRLGRTLDYSALQTRLRNGILTISLPKLAASANRVRHAA